MPFDRNIFLSLYPTCFDKEDFLWKCAYPVRVYRLDDCQPRRLGNAFRFQLGNFPCLRYCQMHNLNHRFNVLQWEKLYFPIVSYPV